MILLEGGSAERDNVDWMRRYKKPAIAPALAEITERYPDWSLNVLQPFPSLTIACHRPPIAFGGAR